MFVNNKSKKEIKLRSFEGYKFFIPVGVSWIWDKAGEYLVTEIFTVSKVPPKDKYGYDNGSGIPDLLRTNEDAWLKGGKQLCRVERFQINGKQVPRKELIKVAQKRGVPQSRYFEYVADENIDAAQIAEDINNLPVPEDVRYPANFESLGSVPVTPSTEPATV